MRVGFFGGRFDPPHRGHLAVARAAAQAFALDRVLMAPVAVQPLKPDVAEASFADRLAMVRLICADSKGLEASDVDAPRGDGMPNYTIDTLRRLHEELPKGTELFVIAGEDAFKALRAWREPEALLRAAQWIVVSRPHAAESWGDLNLTAEQLARVHRLDGVEEPASATQIRQELHAGDACLEWLPTAVLDYIRAKHLYGM